MERKSAEQSHDVLRTRTHPLVPLFAPQTVAVIGATEKEGSVGRAVLQNLVTFSGRVFPVNPKRPAVLGKPAFASVAAIPEQVDLAVIVTPATTVPDIIRQCVAARIRAAIIISAGFKESGAEGAELEGQILVEAHRGDMRIIGPNCLGVMSPYLNFNATFAASIARPGPVAFISQSGALCTAILDWSFRQNVGFSAFVSIGSMLDVGWGDLIYYLGDDPHTKSIVCYMESVGDARKFLSAAREVALTKPIIVIKVGRTGAAAKAAASHTGSLTGSDEVLDAAFRRVGVLRVSRTFDEHETQLRAALAGTVPGNAGFIQAFLRPAGVNVPATPVFAEAVEAMTAIPAPHRRAVLRSLVRPAAVPLAHGVPGASRPER